MYAFIDNISKDKEILDNIYAGKYMKYLLKLYFKIFNVIKN